MKLRMLGTIGLAAALALTACGGGSEESAASGGDDEVTVVGTTDLKFNPTELAVASGGTVTFENASTPGLKHNFVVVRPGTEDSVAQEALPDGEVDEGDDVLVASDLIDGGEEEDVEIDLEAGTYSYICTFPGHETTMRGTLTVQ